ncbi:Alpha/Beta hydrolase protein [Dichotomocladium elegans]|nr:Alpha/Beta hydrolase protein [Dichotomocladium elegans]
MDPSDPSTFNHKFFNHDGLRLHYVDENPSSTRPLLLVHGWPDLWLGWREQIPYLAKLGYRVIVPTLRGFGDSEGPEDPAQYTDKVISSDLIALLDHLQIPTVTVIGHDWGGLVAWRICQYYPTRIEAVASFCTPYFAPSKEYVPLADLVKILPNFKYQLYLITPEAEKDINGDPEAFFKRMFRPVGDMEPLIDKEIGTLVTGRPLRSKSDAIPQKVLDYYVSRYRARGAGKSLNMYKRHRYNYEAAKDLDPIIAKPALMVTAAKDAALPPEMAHGMDRSIPKLEMHNIDDAGHWVLWEKPKEANKYLGEWLAKL